MRQVPYERPKEFIDRYSPLPKNPIFSKRYKFLKLRQTANAISSRDQEVSTAEHEDDPGSGRKCRKSLAEEEKDFRNLVELPRDKNVCVHTSEFNICDNILNSFGEQGDENLQEGVDFGKIERNMTINEYMSSSDGTYQRILEAKTVISCWLEMREQDLGSLVISAHVTEGRRAGILAEAEIGLSQLFDVKGIMTETLKEDPSILCVTCREILETVELRIQDEHTRLVLSLSTLDDSNDSLYSEEASLEDVASQDPSVKEDSIYTDILRG